MLELLLTAALTAITFGRTYHVQWEPKSNQAAIVAITECKGSSPFFAFDRFELTEDAQDSIDVRRQPTPHNVRCTVTMSLMLSREDSPDEDIDPEQSIVIIQQD